MKLFVTTEERKKLLKKGFRSYQFIQIEKILEQMNISEDKMNDRLRFIVNSEIKKRIKLYYQKGSETIIYRVNEISDDVIFNMQLFFDQENMGVNIILIDFSEQWKELHDLFFTVITS